MRETLSLSPIITGSIREMREPSVDLDWSDAPSWMPAVGDEPERYWIARVDRLSASRTGRMGLFTTEAEARLSAAQKGHRVVSVHSFTKEEALAYARQRGHSLVVAVTYLDGNWFVLKEWRV